VAGVRFGVPAEVAFDYLVDPHHRPEWQSSLRRVEDVDAGAPRVGQRWVDVTVPGLRPRMETTRLERPDTWSETGTWRGFDAVLTLTFEPADDGCEVGVEMRLTGRGPARPLAAVLNVLSPRAVRADLIRASRILSRPTDS
jgi:uncharacterized protein YndB with AHSA1/START domain